MFSALRQAIIMLVARGQQRETDRDARRLLATVGSWFRKPGEIKGKLDRFARIAEIHETEVRSWVAPDVIADGRGGAFDACDLRIWLALADRAGVPYVPAREVLHLNEDEMSHLSGKVEMPDTASGRLIRKRLAEMPELLEGAESPPPPADIDHDALVERLYAAMDDVPEGWMVRCHRAGSTELKSLAGAGAIGDEDPAVKFGTDLEVGPGWIRDGNRRRVHVSDNRTVQVIAQGQGDAAFLARPWKTAARYFEGPDPHRHGSAFAGKGRWPAEWRAFVVDGKVEGVSVYYPWCGELTAENARMAIAVKGMAQRIVDEAVRMRAFPRLPEIEFARDRIDDEQIVRALEKFGRESVGCTLDFIEVVNEGLMLLEGGPACTPFGGGHPCGFAGTYRPGQTPPAGVAFKLMDGILLGDTATWKAGGDRAGRILDWEAVEVLARQ